MNNMNIFNVQTKYLELARELEDNGGELTPELEEALSKSNDDIETQVKNYHYLISLFKGDLVVINDEIERLNIIKKTKENTIERFRNVLLNLTLFCGYDGKTGNKKLEFDTIKLWTVNKESVQIDDEDNFKDPTYTGVNLSNLTLEEYDLIKDLISSNEPSYKIFKSNLTAALKRGEEIENAKLVTKPYVVIK